MKDHNRIVWRGCSLVVALLLLIGCKKTIKWDSVRPEQAIVVDGNLDDWGSTVQSLSKKGIRVAVANDDEFLYIGLSTDDPDVQRQVMARGLLLWLDAEGGRGKTFGIKYPIGLTATMIGQGGFGRRGGEGLNEEERRRRFEDSLVNLEIHDTQEDPLRLTVAEFEGGELAFARSFGSASYELKIPLQITNAFPYAVGAAPGAAIGIGIETPELDREELREQFGGMGGRGGRGGQGGFGGTGQGGGFGGGRGPGGQSGGFGGGPRGLNLDQALKVWAKVALAE